MPRRMVRRSTKRQRGSGLGSWLKKAGAWIKKHKLISRIGSILGSAGVPLAGTIGTAAGAIGYGRMRRRRVVGRGLRLPGGSMSRPSFAVRV
jgi:hypothetical protein